MATRQTETEALDAPLLTILKDVLAEEAGSHPPVALDSELTDLGIDSLLLAEVFVRLEDETGHYFGLDSRGKAILTVGDLRDALTAE